MLLCRSPMARPSYALSIPPWLLQKAPISCSLMWGARGISEVFKIATMAEAFNVKMAPHLSVAWACIAATIQVAAAIPNLYLLEYQPPVFEIANHHWSRAICRAGYYEIPSSAGLGVSLDSAALARVAGLTAPASRVRAAPWAARSANARGVNRADQFVGNLITVPEVAPGRPVAKHDDAALARVDALAEPWQIASTKSRASPASYQYESRLPTRQPKASPRASGAFPRPDEGSALCGWQAQSSFRPRPADICKRHQNVNLAAVETAIVKDETECACASWPPECSPIASPASGYWQSIQSMKRGP